MDVIKIESSKEIEAHLRKQARKIVRQKNGDAIKRPTHLFMHEKDLTEIVSFFLFVPC